MSRVMRDKVCGCCFCKAISPDDDDGLRAAATTVSPRSKSCKHTAVTVECASLSLSRPRLTVSVAQKIAGHYSMGPQSPLRHHTSGENAYLLTRFQAQAPASSCYHVHSGGGHADVPTYNSLPLVLELRLRRCDAVMLHQDSLILKLRNFEALNTELKSSALRYERLPMLQKLLQSEQLCI